MTFELISCALLLAYIIGSILQYRNVDLSQMELGRTLLGNNATHHPVLAPMIVLHDVVSVVMTLLLVRQFVRSRPTKVWAWCALPTFSHWRCCRDS